MDSPFALAARHEEPAAKLAAALERLSRLLAALNWQASGPQGLTALQAAILETLADQPQGVGELARWLRVSKPTVSRALKTLVRKDLVQVSPDPGDRRRVQVRLTPEGRRRLAASQRWAEPLMQALHSLPRQQQGQLLRALLEMLRQLERAGLMAQSRMCLTCRFLQDHGEELFCQLLGKPLAGFALRLDCPDHQPLAVPLSGGANR